MEADPPIGTLACDRAVDNRVYADPFALERVNGGRFRS